VFVKKNYLSSWVFTAMQSVHIRIKSSLSPPPKTNPGSAYVQCIYFAYEVGTKQVTTFKANDHMQRWQVY